MPFLWRMSRLINVSANDKATKETECSATLRYALVFLLVVCAFAAVFFGAAAAHSAVALRRPMRTVLLPLRSAILHSSVLEIDGNSRLATVVDADRSLNAAAAVQRNSAPSTRYTVHVRLAGGTEELIPVTAPPGGLQLEVRDMTGDNVQNDLVLRPALIHWPLIVLLNDGHDHFTVAISATLPSSLDSGSRASGARQVPETVALASSSCKAGPQARNGQLFIPRLQKGLLSPLTQRVTNRMGHESISERAPPTIATRI
jgi:hypothetical protein